MKLQIESTTKIVELNGVPARIWEGHSESGVPVVCFVTRVAVREGEPMGEFERELLEHKPPSGIVDRAFDARLAL